MGASEVWRFAPVSLLYSVVFASRARSNHHRLALDALLRLEGSEGAAWRDLFLHYHEAYLEGAKAPDEVFKDFKNHVLHVRDGYWGGAVEAAEEWQRRMVRALKAKDWKHAVYCAGVMSHYIVDPIQPFHTHQTEEEGVIHRAVEQSFSKAYAQMRTILLVDQGGWPNVPLPAGADWLAQLIRAGAHAANKHYETIIEHYDFERGVKDPLAGLDQEIKDIIAGLIGLAVATLSRALAQSFAEAQMRPPLVSTNLDLVFTAMSAPIGAVLAKIDDVKARAEVQAQYEEFRRTGKVRATLGEDDKVVRQLYATEVAKVELSSLDARWPREVGKAHGAGAPARVTLKPKQKPPRAKAPPRPKPEPKKKPTLDLDAVAPVELDIIAPPKPAPKLETKPQPAPKAVATPGASLAPDDDVIDAPSIGQKTAGRLQNIGVSTVADLLAANPEKAAARLNARHITPNLVRDWQAQAALACALPGLRAIDAQLLVLAGVRDVDLLAAQTLDGLISKLDQATRTQAAQDMMRGAQPPNKAQAERWIETAKTTPAAKAA
jgi:predicted flap endonuclease-1-like 5' DNA nuclease